MNNGMPKQGTVEERVANSLTNGALAHRLDVMRTRPRSMTRAEKDAFLHEAANRLKWEDNYDKHKGN